MFDESLAESWQRRFGRPLPLHADRIASLLAHRSVRKFMSQAIPEAVMEIIFAAGQSAATSSNLQLYSAVSIQDPVTRAEAARLCDDQDQVETAAWFFAFFADHARLRVAAAEAGEAAAGLDYLEYFVMAIIDAALAAERMVVAAETLGIGTCYIGALRNDAEGVAQLVRAPEGSVGLFGLCFGWPDPEQPASIKPRLETDVVWYRESFPVTPSIGDYNDRMAKFYASQDMSTRATWAMRSGRRVDDQHLFGRERLKSFIEKQGFARR